MGNVNDGESALCAMCGSPIASKADTGRPSSYCGIACRRAGEYALKRKQTALLANEREQRSARLIVENPDSLEAIAGDNFGRVPQRVLDDLVEEQQRLEGELRSLLHSLD